MNCETVGTVMKIRKKCPDDKVIAVAGNPNVGKSTVFNALTGLNQHTGNWSGKTVSNAQGYFRYKNQGFVLVDIPGCYSLNSHSAEEEVARNFICFSEPDLTVIVCDAVSLERNLNLVLQILEITDRAIICVNLIDEAEKHGIRINFSRLSEILGVPVIPAAARSGYGLDNLTEEIYRLSCHNLPCKPFRIKYSPELEKAVDIVMPSVKKLCENNRYARWLSLKLLEQDISLISSVNAFYGINLMENQEVSDKLSQAYSFLENKKILPNQFGEDVVSCVVHTAEDIFSQTVSFSSDRYCCRDRKIDKFLTGKKTGFISMFAMLMLIFWITVSGANYPSALLQKVLFSFEEPFFDMIISVGLPQWSADMFAYGVYRVLAWIVSVMLPPMTGYKKSLLMKNPFI